MELSSRLSPVIRNVPVPSQCAEKDAEECYSDIGKWIRERSNDAKMLADRIADILHGLAL
jgi:hypothetical protein